MRSCGRSLAKDQEAGRDTGSIKDVQWQGDHGVDQAGVEEGVTDQVFVVGFALFALRTALEIGFVVKLRLATEEHALRADDAGSTGLQQ